MCPLSLDEQKNHFQAKTCYLCNINFINNEDIDLAYHGINIRKKYLHHLTQFDKHYFPTMTQLTSIENAYKSQNDLKSCTLLIGLKDYLTENDLLFQKAKTIPNLKLIKVHDHDHITGRFTNNLNLGRLQKRHI